MSDSSCLTPYLHNTLQSAHWGHSTKGFYYSCLPRLKAEAENGDFFLSVSYESPTYFLKFLILICSSNEQEIKVPCLCWLLCSFLPLNFISFIWVNWSLEKKSWFHILIYTRKLKSRSAWTQGWEEVSKTTLTSVRRHANISTTLHVLVPGVPSAISGLSSPSVLKSASLSKPNTLIPTRQQSWVTKYLLFPFEWIHIFLEKKTMSLRFQKKTGDKESRNL